MYREEAEFYKREQKFLIVELMINIEKIFCHLEKTNTMSIKCNQQSIC